MENEKPVLKGRKLDVKEMRVTAVELSGDGSTWGPADDLDSTGNLSRGLAHIVDLLANGERVFLRAKYVDIYTNGSRSFPKLGGAFEVQLIQLKPMALIETTAQDVINNAGESRVKLP